MPYPIQGYASTYSDYFKWKRTASGEVYSHDEYTAALLPRANWYRIPMGTKLLLTYRGRQVVVKVNDRGAGKITDKTTGTADPTRVLDLSRAAMAYLIGVPTHSITDRNASIIRLERIEVIAEDSLPTGPAR